MNKKIITLVVACFVSWVGLAQKTTDSPYSYYGIGELNFGGSVEERAMGGIGVYADSTRLNMQNPAALSKLQYTAYTAGFSLKSKKIESSTSSARSKASSVDYGALGFPIAKDWGVSLGLLPYSSVGYQLSTLTNTGSTATYVESQGSGGVNQFFLSSGYRVYKNLSIGASLRYNFGRIEMVGAQRIQNVQMLTQEYSESLLRGAAANFGLYYEEKLNTKLNMSASLVYTPQSKLTSDNTRTISVGEYSNGSFVARDVQSANLSASGLAETKLTLPSQWSLGFGVGQKQKWFAGVDYTHINTENFANPFLSTSNTAYENGYKLALGGFFIPQYNSFSSYWKRVIYRGGLHFEKTGIVLNNESINDFGISFGVSLPVKGFSIATLAMEYGKKGTLSQNLVKENYLNLRLGFTLNDKWFQRTKYQ